MLFRSNRKMIENYFELVATTPVYQLTFPADLPRIGRTIGTICSMLSSGRRNGDPLASTSLAGAPGTDCTA